MPSVNLAVRAVLLLWVALVAASCGNPAIALALRPTGFGPDDDVEIKCLAVNQFLVVTKDLVALEASLKPYYAAGWRLAYAYSYTSSAQAGFLGSFCLERRRRDGKQSANVPTPVAILVGADCRSDLDCGGGRCAVSYPGGYCTEPCPCGEGGTCSSELRQCLKACGSAKDCRYGYMCDQMNGTSAKACVPDCRVIPSTCQNGTKCDSDGYCR